MDSRGLDDLNVTSLTNGFNLCIRVSYFLAKLFLISLLQTGQVLDGVALAFLALRDCALRP